MDEYGFPGYVYENAANKDWQNQNIRPARAWLMKVEGLEEWVK